MEMKSKVIYGIAVFMVISVGVSNPDYSSENPPEKKLCDKEIRVNSTTSPTSAFVTIVI